MALDNVESGLCSVSENVENSKNAFESTPFYQMVAEGTDNSLNEAIELLAGSAVDVNLKSHREGTKGWNYLHYIVDRLAFSEFNIMKLSQ